MTHFNDTDLCPSTSRGIYTHPSLRQTLATDTKERNGPTSPRARTDGYDSPLYDWDSEYKLFRSRRPGSLDQGGSVTNMASSERSTAVPGPSSASEYHSLSLEGLGAYRSHTVPLGYWGASQSGVPTSAPYIGGGRVRSSLRNPIDAIPRESAATSHWPMTGPNTRAEVVPPGWFQSTQSRANCHRNPEAGPSTLVAPPAPRIDPPTPQPSGGTPDSETTADAETQQTTEEDRTPVSNFYWSHIPRVTEWLFSVRHPSGPGSPAARGDYVTTVYGWGEEVAGCESWCSG